MGWGGALFLKLGDGSRCLVCSGDCRFRVRTGSGRGAENVVEYCIFVDGVSGQAATVEALWAVRQDILALVAEVCGREAGTPNRGAAVVGAGCSSSGGQTFGPTAMRGLRHLWQAGAFRAGRARGRSDPCLRRRVAPA